MTTSWDFIATELEKRCGVQVDWQHQSFICPECGCLIKRRDFYYMPCDGTPDNPIAYCPVCARDYNIKF